MKTKIPKKKNQVTKKTLFVIFLAIFSSNIIAQNPNLTIQNASATYTFVYEGDIISTSCEIQNSSAYNAAESSIGYYLSSDSAYDNADIFLAENTFNALSAGSSANGNDTVVIPAETNPGNYYILFYADYDNSINEGIESNNIAGVPITVSSTVSVRNITNNIFSVYPNPAEEIFFITLNNDINIEDIYKIELIDITGKLRKTVYTASGTNKITINTENNSPGLYYLKLTTSGKNVFVKKLILK